MNDVAFYRYTSRLIVHLPETLHMPNNLDAYELGSSQHRVQLPSGVSRKAWRKKMNANGDKLVMRFRNKTKNVGK